MSDKIETSKAITEHINKPWHLLPDDLPLPEELAHLPEDEIRRLDRRLTKTLDMTLLPVVFLLFLLNILDRNNIASAKISGLTTTLGMTNSEYNTCLLMFYVGYCITQVPSNMIIGKVRPSLYICLVTSLWGVLSMSQGFTQNFSQLAAVRFVLGLVEAPFIPAVFVLAFSGLIAAGITSRMEGAAGRPAWEWLFIIEGSMTVVIAILVLPLLTDYPLQSKHILLSRELQLYAEYRVRKENAGIVDEDPESIWWGLKQALIDPKLYMFFVMQMALITSQSFNNFFPSIVGTLGYGREKTLLLTSPPYFFAFIVSIVLSFHAAHAHERGYHIAIPMLFALLGHLLAMFIPSTGGRYFSMFLMTAGSYSPYNLCMSWVSASLPRPRAKRAAALAIVNFMSAGVAHFYTSYMFPDSQKPRYYAGGAVMAGASIVCAGVALFIKRHLRQQNARFEEEEEGHESRDGDGIAYGQIQGSKKGHGGNAMVSFRYVH
ncbi:fad-binding domain-containing protein [Apiospora arundinis]